MAEPPLYGPLGFLAFGTTLGGGIPLGIWMLFRLRGGGGGISLHQSAWSVPDRLTRALPWLLAGPVLVWVGTEMGAGIPGPFLVVCDRHA